MENKRLYTIYIKNWKDPHIGNNRIIFQLLGINKKDT